MTSPDKGAGSARESALREELAETLAALLRAQTNLAALVEDPSDPDFGAACPNPADAECLALAYSAVRSAIQDAELATLATDSQAPGGREGEDELLAALRRVQTELAALVADPSNPDFSFACPNPADSQCLELAYDAVRLAISGAAPPPDTRPAETVRGLEEVDVDWEPEWPASPSVVVGHIAPVETIAELERELGVTGTVAVFRRSLELAREARAGRLAPTGTGWVREGVGRVLYEHAYDCLTKDERDGIVDDLLALHPERTEAGGGFSFTGPELRRVEDALQALGRAAIRSQKITEHDKATAAMRKCWQAIEAIIAARAPAPSAPTDAGGQG